jgi:PleD family two-component response regulator
MHDMDGLLFPEISVKDRRLTKPRIIALTDNDNPDIAVKILNQGAVDYIPKPINLDLLKAKIDVHISLFNAEQTLEQHLNKQIFFDKWTGLYNREYLVTLLEKILNSRKIPKKHLLVLT